MFDELAMAMDLPTVAIGRTFADVMDLPELGPKATKSPRTRQQRLAAQLAEDSKSTRSMAGGSKGEVAAREHADLAEANGWVVELTSPADNEWVVTAKQNDCLARVAWKNNNVNYPLVTATFPLHEVWLKNTTQWRRQITLPVNERPAQPTPKVGKKTAKRVVAYEETASVTGEVTEESGPAYNVTNLPFARDDEDGVIIDMVKGQTLYWRNTLAQRVEHAQLPAGTKTIRISAHPRTGRRILSFPESHGWDAQTATEVLGAERSVALDQMIRLG